MKTTIHYSSDVNIEDHSNFVVFHNKHNGEDAEAISIERDGDSETVKVYFVELFKSPSDSWLNNEDLESVNSYTGMNYNMNSDLVGNDKFLFSQDLCSYYGAINFDGNPIEFQDQNSFELWLRDMNLIN